jgi:hypothetical protein
VSRNMTRQIGRFVIEGAFFDRLQVGYGVNLFDKMIVLDVTRDWMTDRATYTAVHEQFRAIDQGDICPYYKATFTADSVLPKWVELPINERYGA